MFKSKKGVAGFTLIELLLVVIVIGIVAVVAIPQFTDSVRDTKESTLRADLAALRNAAELYYHQHSNNYPGNIDHTDGSGAPSDRYASFLAQITQYSDATGKISATLDRPNYPYGPYLKHGIPGNPCVESDASGTVISDSVKVVASTGVLSPDAASTTTGWMFNCSTGEIIANCDDTSS
ncbi:MAG: prepilin-type N-terminal cleavage/methylation domain-containing protein, partial [Candidatus Eisenbacteria sp.]|nr:prepilin-type N-terminal cleavage/methylation domain-containing protein [Candidatus Eisenbacteria bacterium]